MSNFIDDDYTKTGYIAAVPGLHDEMAFEFRPVLSRERVKLEEAGAKLSAEKFDDACAAAVAPKIVSWELADRHGKTVECTPANLLRVHPTVWNKLYRIVVGYQPSDELPAGRAPAETRTSGIEQGEAAEKN